MTRLLFDLETDGLLPELTKVHCLVIKDIDTGEKWTCNNQGAAGTYTPEQGAIKLRAADELYGHNILVFDLPALAKVYPWFGEIPVERVKDTLILARLYHQNIKESDLVAWKQQRFPGQLMGRHSLEAWGVRLGEAKVGLDIKDWSHWTPYMQERCEQDVETNHALLQHIRKQEPWPHAELLEHRASLLCSRIENNGIPFDTAGAASLYASLCEMRTRMAGELQSLFPDWVIFKGEFTPKVSNSKTGNVKDCPYSKIEIVEFNPRSRDHIAYCLKSKYAWVPVEMTDGGKPKIDEKVLSPLPYPEAKPLAELFLIEKRIGQIAEGDEAWLKHEKNGWIHHRINPNGAVTGRATHSKPNISQVPKVGSRFGKECRSFFHVPAGWTQVGVDVAGLELRALAHFMSPYDKGEYGKAVIEGNEEEGTDVHSLNCRAIGMLPKEVYTINGKQQTGRNCAKTFIYAFLYGAGAQKIGTIVGKRPSRGAAVRKDFLARVPALGKLQEAAQKVAKRGYLKALDGRHMRIRSEHSALNTLLQGAGALICKQWIVETEKLLLEQGLAHGWDGDFAFLLWAHDELQIACKTPEIATIVETAAHDAIQLVQESFSFRLPLAVSCKRGSTWAECH